MNSRNIIERQNEPFMLKIQYAARYCYNMAEKQNYFVWLFCFASAFSIFLTARLPEYLSHGIPFTADIIAWFIMTSVNKNVQKAADLRRYFDSYSIGISTDQYSDSEKRRLTEIAEKIYSKKSKDAELQMANTGNDNPPGVHDWYIFSKQYDGLEAKFECQRQNTWWDKKLFQKKCAAIAILFVIVVLVFITLMICNDFVKILLCSAGLLIKLLERIIDNCKYIILSIKIDGAQQTLEARLTIEGIKQLQMLIDERRAVNILGINSLHKIFANKLTKQYDNMSNPQ